MTNVTKDDNKPTLHLDFDETLVDTMKSFCTVYNEWYADKDGFTPANHEEVYLYDFKDQCPLLETKQDVHDIFDSGNFFNKLQLKTDCLDVLHEYKHKFNYQIVTIGTPRNLAHKALWIESNLPFIQNVILMSNGNNKMDKSMIDMRGSRLMPNIFIDDHHDNLLSSNCNFKFCLASYGEREWNNLWEEKVKDWKQIDMLLKTYVGKYL